MRRLLIALIGTLAGAFIAGAIGWSIGYRMGGNRSEKSTASGLIGVLMGFGGALAGGAVGASSERRLLPGTSVLSVRPGARKQVASGAIFMGLAVGALISAEAKGQHQNPFLFGGLGFLCGCVMGAVICLQSLNEERRQGKNAGFELPPEFVDLGGEDSVRVTLERFCPTCGHESTVYRGSEMQGGRDPYVEHFLSCPGCKRSWSEHG